MDLGVDEDARGDIMVEDKEKEMKMKMEDNKGGIYNKVGERPIYDEGRLNIVCIRKFDWQLRVLEQNAGLKWDS